MSIKSLLVAGAFSALLGSSVAQQVGTNQAEVHPPVNVGICTKSGGCSTQKRSIVLDANWRWVHNVGGSTNCYTGNQWNTQYCPDGTSCAKNCALDGASYESTYGITTSGSAVTLKYVTGNNVGGRVYLLDATDSKYEMLKLKNKEFSFDVDLSTLPCGLNGALYLAEMPADGGMSATNTAGAKYGTGYCDAQCAQDIKFINGKANLEGWTTVDENSGKGNIGSCCSEMDIWEANKISSAFTPHPCSKPGLYACTGTECGSGDNRYNGVCDKDGCDYNTYRQGNKTFYGPGMTVDTSKPFTVVTQFVTTDGTDSGDLADIRRFYVQGGKTIPIAASTYPELNGANSITDSYCKAQKTLFGDKDSFSARGGLKTQGQVLDRGMVLVLSVWDDVTVNMLWLDAVAYPTSGDPNKPGIGRGTCATNSGEPKATRAANPNAYVTYSNIKWGELGSTNNVDPYCSSSPSRQCGNGGTTTRPPTSSTTTTRGSTSTSAATTTTTTTASSPSPSPAGSCSAKWAQCGGIGWAGPTCCVSGTTCNKLNDYYSQCL